MPRPTYEEQFEARRRRLGFVHHRECRDDHPAGTACVRVPVPYRTLGLGIERFYRVVPNSKA